MSDSPLSPEALSAGGEDALPAWDECDIFCIRHYAALGSAACGWRGRSTALPPGIRRPHTRCPRCGFATLLQIPQRRAPGSAL